MKKYKCTCGLAINKVYEVRSAVWKKDISKEEDRGEIAHYGDTHYSWECSNHECYEGAEWNHNMPEEWSEEE